VDYLYVNRINTVRVDFYFARIQLRIMRQQELDVCGGHASNKIRDLVQSLLSPDKESMQSATSADHSEINRVLRENILQQQVGARLVFFLYIAYYFRQGDGWRGVKDEFEPD